MIKFKRNDPCPCGSGKKYKKCCLKQYQTYQTTDTMSPSEIETLAKHIQQKCIAEHGDNEYAAKQFWNQLVTAVYDRNPAAVLSMIKVQPEEDNREYITQIYKELSCSKD